MNKRILSVLIAFLLVLCYSPIYGLNTTENTVVSSRFVTLESDGEQIVGVEITRFNNDEVIKSLTLFYEEDGDNITFVHPSLACTKTISGVLLPKSGTTFHNVTGSAIYNAASDGYGGYYYRPRRVEGVTTGTTKFTLQYSTGGGRLNTSLQSTHTGGIHEIFLTQDSPIANQVYSTTLVSSYYYNVTSGYVDPHHILYFTVGTSYQLTWNLPPYTN